MVRGLRFLQASRGSDQSCFIVRDNNGQALAYVYFEAEQIGEYAADKQLIALHRAHPLTLRQKSRSVMTQMQREPWFDELEEQWQAWPRIRRDLGIEEPTEDEL